MNYNEKNIKMKKIFLLSYLIVLLTMLVSCVEPIELENKNFEDLLVVEALLTNENKRHVVTLTRTINLDSVEVKKEKGAFIVVKDDSNNVFTFSEEEDGKYVSDESFKAEDDKKYTLEITTNTGGKYVSTAEGIVGTSNIGNINVEKEINPLGKEGLSFYVESANSSREGLYFRYEYEETFKVVAPFWNDKLLKITNPDFPFAFEVVDDVNNLHKQVCFKTQNSSTIILAETGTFGEEANKSVRFIERDDYIISHRYSLLVKQYVQSANSYNYYRVLSKISTSQDLFSQSQPGKLESNIKAEGTATSVVGVFEVSSVSEKRIYINFTDFFPDTVIGYAVDCEFSSPTINLGLSQVDSFLIMVLEGGFYIYYMENGSTSDHMGPYNLVTTACGDCSVIANSEKPDYWID